MKKQINNVVRYLSLCLIVAIMFVSAGCDVQKDNESFPLMPTFSTVGAEILTGDSNNLAKEEPTNITFTSPQDTVHNNETLPDDESASEESFAETVPAVNIKPPDPEQATFPKESPTVIPTEAPEPTVPVLPDPEPPTLTPTEAPTEPVPEETEPAGCQHNWQTVWHPEEGHYGDPYCVCKCGWRFSNSSEWPAHVEANAAEAVDRHTSWYTTQNWIVDIPEYTNWICSKCGAVSSVAP